MRCLSCGGSGKVKCWRCDGRGWSYTKWAEEFNRVFFFESYPRIDRLGSFYRNSCYSCGSSGQIRCYKCNGSGNETDWPGKDLLDRFRR